MAMLVSLQLYDSEDIPVAIASRNMDAIRRLLLKSLTESPDNDVTAVNATSVVCGKTGVGYEVGPDKGRDEGFDEGCELGCRVGRDDGNIVGCDDGWHVGREDGCSDG